MSYQTLHNRSDIILKYNYYQFLTSSPLFRKIQVFLRDRKVVYQSLLSEDRKLVVIKGIPTDISEEEVKSKLELVSFEIKDVKRFGYTTILPSTVSICVIILSKTLNVT